MATEDFKRKLISQICNSAPRALAAVGFDVNLESLVPRRIAGSLTFHCTLCITPNLYWVNSKPSSLGSGYSVPFLIQNLKGC